MKRVYAVLTMIALTANTAAADCIFKQPQEKIIMVEGCTLVTPSMEPKLNAFLARYPQMYAENVREKYEKEARRIVDAYRGAIIEEKSEQRRTPKYFYASNDTGVCSK